MELALQVLAFPVALAAATYTATFAGVLWSFAFLSFERSREAPPGSPEAKFSLPRLLRLAFWESLASYATVLLRPLYFLEPPPSRPEGTPKSCPVLFVHGYHGHGANFRRMRSLLARQGILGLASYTYPTTRGTLEEMARILAAQVEVLRKTTGAARVDLVGHSLGGLVSQYYVARLGGAPFVRRVIAIGSPLAGTRLAHFFPRHPYGLFHPALPHLAGLRDSVRQVKDTAFISIYSRDDQLVVPGESGRLEGFGTNHPLSDIGHNGLLFSRQTARLAARELLGS